MSFLFHSGLFFGKYVAETLVWHDDWCKPLLTGVLKPWHAVCWQSAADMLLPKLGIHGGSAGIYRQVSLSLVV